MYSLAWMKFSRRWRRLAFRLSTRTYSIWVGATVLSLAGLRAAVLASGPRDTHRARVAADGNYAKRRGAEANDNPLYRLPENPAGGHRLDGLSPWQARAEGYRHH